ncbi:MAG: hypothetical protein AB7G80_07635 [Dongiaceae bacterium]
MMSIISEIPAPAGTALDRLSSFIAVPSAKEEAITEELDFNPKDLGKSIKWVDFKYGVVEKIGIAVGIFVPIATFSAVMTFTWEMGVFILSPFCAAVVSAGIVAGIIFKTFSSILAPIEEQKEEMLKTLHMAPALIENARMRNAPPAQRNAHAMRQTLEKTVREADKWNDWRFKIEKDGAVYKGLGLHLAESINRHKRYPKSY